MPAVIAVLLLALAAVPLSGRSVDAEAVVRAAIVHAVSSRMGDASTVTLESLEVRAPAVVPGGVRAVPPPGARTSRLISFALFEGSRRVGTATAVVRVALPHLRVAARVARDTAITAADVTTVDGEIDGARLVRLPGAVDVAGALARRNLVPGEPLTYAIVQVPPAVRPGDEVEVVSRVGTVEARGTGRASSSGRVGARIRVTSGTGRVLRSARVIGPGVVELLGPGERPQGEQR